MSNLIAFQHYSLSLFQFLFLFSPTCHSLSISPFTSAQQIEWNNSSGQRKEEMKRGWIITISLSFPFPILLFPSNSVSFYERKFVFFHERKFVSFYERKFVRLFHIRVDCYYGNFAPKVDCYSLPFNSHSILLSFNCLLLISFGFLWI